MKKIRERRLLGLRARRILEAMNAPSELMRINSEFQSGVFKIISAEPDNTVAVAKLFQQATTGTPTEYAQIQETINPKASELMGEWTVNHAKTK